MGIHELVTGLNGHGKTLYTVAVKLKPLIGTKVGVGEKAVPARLVVGGIRDLLIDHDLMEVPELDPEGFVDVWGKVNRDPGKPAVRFVREGSDGFYAAAQEDEPGAEPLVWSILNWWLWVEPGMILTVDECQRVFRPMASGKRVPRFVARLETARHYGIRFVYITQHPNLIHTNVRQLAGPIEDVSRVFGGARTTIRQWDRIGDYGKKAQAVTRFWKHDKAAFGLYKSAELHTKFGQKLPLAVFAVVAALIGLAVLGWVMKNRMAERFSPAPVAAAKVASAPANGAPGAPQQVGGGQVAKGDRWPLYDAGEVGPERDPYAARALQLEGGYTVGSKTVRLFGLLVDGTRVATVRLDELVRMGYTWRENGPCSGALLYGQTQRLVTCGKPVTPDLAKPSQAQQEPPAEQKPSA